MSSDKTNKNSSTFVGVLKSTDIANVSAATLQLGLYDGLVCDLVY